MQNLYTTSLQRKQEHRSFSTPCILPRFCTTSLQQNDNTFHFLHCMIWHCLIKNHTSTISTAVFIGNKYPHFIYLPFNHTSYRNKNSLDLSHFCDYLPLLVPTTMPKPASNSNQKKPSPAKATGSPKKVISMKKNYSLGPSTGKKEKCEMQVDIHKTLLDGLYELLCYCSLWA